MFLEFRVLWTEIIAGQPIPFSGRVGSFTDAPRWNG
jgi:hypothetical protein